MEKVILVTGASSGIGESIARYLAEQGNTVVLVARNMEKLKQMALELPGEHYAFAYDLRDVGNIGDIFDFCKENDLKLSGLVHCAGMNCDMPIRTNDLTVMSDVLNVNYVAFVEMGKYFSKKKYSHDNSSIVAISSPSAENCMPGMCTYASSKAALNAAVKVMSKEFLKRRIRVNAIAPGIVNTPLVANAETYVSDGNRLEDRTLLGVIEPIEVAYLAEFLLSDKAAYVTGSVIPVG